MQRMAVWMAVAWMLWMPGAAFANAWAVQSGIGAYFETHAAYHSMIRLSADEATGAQRAQERAAMVMGNADFRLLLLMGETEDGWTPLCENMLAVFQDDARAAPALTLRTAEGKSQLTMAYEGMPRLSFVFVEEAEGYVLAEGTVQWGGDAPMRAVWTDGGYSFAGWDAVSGKEKAVLLPAAEPVALDAFDVAQFPTSFLWVEDMAGFISGLGAPLPGGRTLLVGGSRSLPVYQGPGDRYLRLADGAAAMSTAAPFVVYGEEDGWLLVAYGVGARHVRYGYVRQDALSSVEAPVLAPSALRQNASRPVALYDDPIHRTGRMGMLEAGTPLTLLAIHGSLCFVEAEVGGVPARGFVSADAFR